MDRSSKNNPFAAVVPPLPEETHAQVIHMQMMDFKSAIKDNRLMFRSERTSAWIDGRLDTCMRMRNFLVTLREKSLDQEAIDKALDEVDAIAKSSMADAPTDIVFKEESTSERRDNLKAQASLPAVDDDTSL